VIQRTLKTELFQLAESTINDVEALESSGLKTSSAVTSRFNASAIAASNKNNPISRARILRTLLTELYRKYRVVYKRLRFAYERINYRMGSSSVLVVDVMWESIQEEVSHTRNNGRNCLIITRYLSSSRSCVTTFKIR